MRLPHLWGKAVPRYPDFIDKQHHLFRGEETIFMVQAVYDHQALDRYEPVGGSPEENRSGQSR
jgi:hypothetical protein